jgi:putative MATE family efflux protein
MNMKKDIKQNRNNNRRFILDFMALALPIMLQSLTGNILNICDTMMVGKVSSVAISAVTVSNKVFMIFSLCTFGIASGISMFMSQYYGAENIVKAKKTYKFGLQACVVVALIFLAALTVMPETLIRIFVKGDNIVYLALEYVAVVKWSYIPFAINQISAVLFRVFKKQRIPMNVSILSVGVNILLNYILIYGKFGAPALGVSGAAAATLISRCIECVTLLVMVLVFNNGKEIFTKGYGTLSRNVKLGIMKKTIPLMFNEGIYAIALTLVFRNYCVVNEAYIPAVTVVENVFDLINVAFMGCAHAAGIVIGKVLGSGNMEKAKEESKKLIVLGLSVSLLCSLVVIAISDFVPMLFSLTGNLFGMATTLLRTKAVFSWGQGYGLTVYFILRAGGDVKAVLLLDGLFNLYGPFFISTIVTYCTGWPIQIVYMCTEATYLLKIFIATYFYKRGKWCRNLTIG